MKIASFNINNVNKRLANLLAWLEVAKPDVVCLQELKATDGDFPRAALANAGYGAVWRGQRSWNGVAILARGREPILTRSELPGDNADRQARYIEAAVGGIVIASLYAPNGNPQPGPKFKAKLAWLDRLSVHAADLWSQDLPVVLAGDYNVVPSDHDIYQSKSKSYAANALVQPQARACFARLIEQGWVDAVRKLHPRDPMYTFWDYLRNRWPRDAGLRIDHLLLSRKAAARLLAASVDRAERGRKGASDHAPVWIELREPVSRSSPRKRGPGLDSGRRGNEQKTSAAKKVAPRPGTARPAKRSERTERRPLLVVDGDSFAHRAYHALPKTIRGKGGLPAGAIVGFANILLRLYREERPRAVLVGWDTLDAETYRHQAFAAYQSGRDFADDLVEQLALIPQFVAACGFANAKRAGYEADDFLAAAAAAEERRGGTVLLASGDRDTFQLASPRSTILYPVRGGGLERIGPAQVRERYGVEPQQVPDFIALRGDPADKIPGAPGVGATGAGALLRQFGSLGSILEAGRFAKEAAKLRLYRSIATMDRKAPLPRLPDQRPTWKRAAAQAQQWELKQLAARLDALAGERSGLPQSR